MKDALTRYIEQPDQSRKGEGLGGPFPNSSLGKKDFCKGFPERTETPR